MNDRIDGKTYVGQRFEFALYSRRGGTYVFERGGSFPIDGVVQPSWDLEG